MPNFSTTFFLCILCICVCMCACNHVCVVHVCVLNACRSIGHQVSFLRAVVLDFPNAVTGEEPLRGYPCFAAVALHLWVRISLRAKPPTGVT